MADTIYKPATTQELIELADDESVRLYEIDTSLITDMTEVFANSLRMDFSGIEDWDVSHVVSMRRMFLNCLDFNEDLNKWDVSQVTDMSQMFKNCENFNKPLDQWNVSKVDSMNEMFQGCSSFNQSDRKSVV